MGTQLNTISWQKSLLSNHSTLFLDKIRHTTNTSPIIYKDEFSEIISNNKENISFLHSQKLKQTLLESKKAFLNLSYNDDKQEETQMEEKSIVLSQDEQRRVPLKKISFKVKKTSSIYRRNANSSQKITISANKVAELTKKFNQIIVENKSIIEETKFRKLAKRVNSYRSVDSDKVQRRTSFKSKSENLQIVRRPSVKNKSTDANIVIVKTKPTHYKRTNSDSKLCVTTKISYLEIPQPTEQQPQRPTTLELKKCIPNKTESTPNGCVRAAIEIFERKSTSPEENTSPKCSPKPIIPEKPVNIIPTRKAPEIPTLTTLQKHEKKTEFDDTELPIINIPAVLPQRRCDSTYEINLKKHSPQKSKSEETLCSDQIIKPNTSFLWRINQDKSPLQAFQPKLNEESSLNSDDNCELVYDTVDVKAFELKITPPPELPPKRKCNSPPPKIPPKVSPVVEEKLYEELNIPESDYEYCESGKYEDVTLNDGYELLESPSKENIYETLPVLKSVPSRRHQQEPLPPRPTSYCSTTQNVENISNCYESIYNQEVSVKKDTDIESNYESIYGSNFKMGGSNRDSLVSSDQQSNSLYGRWGENGIYSGKARSDLSGSDRSDEWIDVSDTEEADNKTTNIVILCEKQRSKKSGWSKHCRDQWSKSPRKFSEDPDTGADSDTDHHYETLYLTRDLDEEYDSFDSDSESEQSHKNNLNDSGVDIANNQLPEPPNNQTYVLTRIAATAGKHMRKLRRNWSLTKNDISKSLSRMTKRKSRTDIDTTGSTKKDERPPILLPNPSIEITASTPTETQFPCERTKSPTSYQNVDFPQVSEQTTKSQSMKGFLNKFRRSMSLSAESASEITSHLNNKPKSTFYLTETIDIDEIEKAEEAHADSGVSLSPVPKHTKTLNRPQSPPPPAPLIEPKKPNRKDRRASSWYAESGVFKSNENEEKNQKKRPNTYWYAEVGLYQPTNQSTPSTSSTENSGNVSVPNHSDRLSQNNSEEYYNMKNSTCDFYNDSINSFSSQEIKKEECFTSLSQEMQLILQDEPLYQFYDAAVVESVCNDGTSECDSDGYEEIFNKKLSSRPSAMELVSPKRNSFAFSRTLWCEVPEVIQSSVLSSLSSHQKKLQEAKFEIITSEASYLNSLNVLNEHFMLNLLKFEHISQKESDILFGKIAAVRECSEKLLQDLERCWQDNILLYGVCSIIQKHADENFDVYVSYCENQILLDATLKKVKERNGFAEVLKELEGSSVCQSLSLYSFLLLPMQRITRFPLLIDAVLKRLSEQDSEFITCQYALASLNKVVQKCNEGARRKERENEMKKISNLLEFSRGVPPIDIISPNRWLIRSGPVTHMQARTDEIKLTFGKRFTKSTLHIFLFNDLIFITKPKNEYTYNVIHYCPRNLVELSSTEGIQSLPMKDAQGRHLLFMTILENQDEKTVEFLLSCSTETDKERWTEALTPPKSEDPDETLYECWDCPQVTAVHNYVSSQPDELPVVRGDVINVLRKMADGWYHGERIRDGQTGWFPANYTIEIANPHVRARNLKQRYRLLAFSQNYLKTK